jgi:hypothetical protein
MSYAGSIWIDYLAPNALFAITTAGTAAVAEFQRSELERVMQADKTKAVLLQELCAPDEEQPGCPGRDDSAGGQERRP